MNGFVKREGIGIQLYDMMRNIKSSHDSYLTVMKALNLAISIEFSDDEYYNQRLAMINA